MRLKDLQQLELPPSADMHVHLRQGELMDLVVPRIRAGGVDTVFVMVKSSRYASRFITCVADLAIA
jgi:dihydroorotase